MISRRTMVLTGSGAIIGGAIFYGRRWPSFAGLNIDAPTAHADAVARRILLIDIRRPDEWQATGVGEGAIPLDMRRDDFTAALAALMPPGQTCPVALICARGVRSARLATAMTRAGQTHVINVPEGMLGAAAGPGWIARGLPLQTA